MDTPLLINTIPELAEELKNLLAISEFPDVADQINELRMVDRCQCDEHACATFYTVARPNGAWGAGHESIDLDSDKGLVVLDLLKRKIVCVEVLNRMDIKQKLDMVLPLKKS